MGDLAISSGGAEQYVCLDPQYSSEPIQSTVDSPPIEEPLESVDPSYLSCQDYSEPINVDSGSAIPSTDLEIDNSEKEISEVESHLRNTPSSMVYSQNYGILDANHLRANFGVYLEVYNKSLDAFQSGETKEISITHGRKTTLTTMTYEISPRPLEVGETIQDASRRIAREITADASYRYEEHTNLFGINSYIPGNVGKSAFSTEDLTSNGLGMEAAEAYTKLANPPSDTEGFLFDRVVSRSGELHYLNDSDDSSKEGIQLERKSFGSYYYYPVYSEDPDAPKRELKPELYDYLRQLDSEHSSPRTDKEWKITDEGSSLAGGAARHAVNKVGQEIDETVDSVGDTIDNIEREISTGIDNLINGRFY